MSADAGTADTGADWGGATIPLHDYMGVDIDVGPPAVATIALTDSVRGAFAPLHGGIYATLADIACAAALARELDHGAGIPVTTDLSIRLFSQPKEGPVRAVAELVHRGSRLVGAECVVLDAQDRQLARATATFMVVPVPGA